MDSASEFAWTLAVIGTLDIAFVFWLAARAQKRGRESVVVASAQLLGSRARRSRI